MVDITKLFYTWDYISCINYTRTLTGGFKFVRLDEGFSHTFMEDKTDYFLFFILDGEIKVSKDNTDSWTAKQHEMFLVYEGVKVECMMPVTLIFFTTDHPGCKGSELLHRLSSVCEKIDYRFRSAEVRKELVLFLILMKSYLVDGIVCGHLQETKQEEFFTLLYNYYTMVELAELFYPVITNKNRDFKKLVTAHCLRARSIGELIEFCGYDPHYFKKTFAEIYHMPVYQWMQIQKEEHIKYRLMDVNVNLKELMAEVGFESPSHFNKFCQKWLGMSPTQYIEMMKNNCTLSSIHNLQ